jgi:hypothetical protein
MTSSSAFRVYRVKRRDPNSDVDAQQGQRKTQKLRHRFCSYYPEKIKRHPLLLKMSGPSVQNVDDIDFSDIEAKSVKNWTIIGPD